MSTSEIKVVEDLISKGEVGDLANRTATIHTLGMEATTVCREPVREETDHAMVLTPSLRERPESTERSNNWRLDRAEDICLGWESFIESLIAAGGDRHVQAFNSVLEEGLGVAPWTMSGTLSFSELVRHSNGHQVPPSWAKPLSKLP
jgi:hypothetical protein